MQGLPLVTLTLMGVIFAIWSISMFRTLWMLTKRSRMRLKDSGGGYFQWLRYSLTAFVEFATSQRDRRARRRLVWLTLAVIASNFVHFFAVSQTI